MPLFKKNHDNKARDDVPTGRDTSSGMAGTGAMGSGQTFGTRENPNMPGQQYDNVPGQHVPGQHVPTAGNTQGHRTMGDKVENAVGSLVGSNALRAKGMEKEREAQAFNIQGQELKEAERLEQEALTHRERAVAHGAHPENRLPGSATGNMAMPNNTTGY